MNKKEVIAISTFAILMFIVTGIVLPVEGPPRFSLSTDVHRQSFQVSVQGGQQASPYFAPFTVDLAGKDPGSSHFTLVIHSGGDIYASILSNTNVTSYQNSIAQGQDVRTPDFAIVSTVVSIAGTFLPGSAYDTLTFQPLQSGTYYIALQSGSSTVPGTTIRAYETWTVTTIVSR